MPRVRAARDAGCAATGGGRRDGDGAGNRAAADDGDGRALGSGFDGDCPGLTAANVAGLPWPPNRPLSDAATPTVPRTIAATTTVGINQG